MLEAELPARFNTLTLSKSNLPALLRAARDEPEAEQHGPMDRAEV